MNIRNWTRAKIGSWARQLLAKRGYLVQRTSKLLIEHPESILHMNFNFAMARHMMEIDGHKITFIQVGAFDGKTNDPLYPYIQRYHWRGVLLEPEPQAFSQLQQTYHDEPQLTLMNCALTDRDGPANLYRIQPGVDGMPDWSRQIATLDVDTLRRHQDGVPAYGIQGGIKDIDRWIECIQVEGISFDHLLDLMGTSTIDLLQIDAEGYDGHIIQRFPFKRVQPSLIHYEHMHLCSTDQEACLAILISQGYRIAVDFADTLAVRKETQ